MPCDHPWPSLSQNGTQLFESTFLARRAALAGALSTGAIMIPTPPIAHFRRFVTLDMFFKFLSEHGAHMKPATKEAKRIADMQMTTRRGDRDGKRRVTEGIGHMGLRRRLKSEVDEDNGGQPAREAGPKSNHRMFRTHLGLREQSHDDARGDRVTKEGM